MINQQIDFNWKNPINGNIYFFNGIVKHTYFDVKYNAEILFVEVKKPDNDFRYNTDKKMYQYYSPGNIYTNSDFINNFGSEWVHNENKNYLKYIHVQLSGIPNEYFNCQFIKIIDNV